jgi:hypothetical protein
MPSPARLSHQLRKGDSPHLDRRRWLVGLSFVGSVAGMIVGLYQMGVLRRLPDLPVGSVRRHQGRCFDLRLQTPDGLLMAATCAVTAILAEAGGRDRTQENPALPIALAAKTLYDAATALKLGQEEWAENKALCGYCQIAMLAPLASVALALPETIEALRHLQGDRDARPA